jgi:glycine/D-amino acid oxidase-like deaminating enzyme
MSKPDFLILGAGIFGITTAIELRKRNYSVTILNPGKIPHPLAESTDISKIIRMEYGSDLEYMEMVEECFPIWREWNDLFKEELYHETGFLLLSKNKFENDPTGFEATSFSNLIKKGYKPERLTQNDIQKRYPAINSEMYADGFYHRISGYAESGRVVEKLTDYARELGCTVIEEQTAEQILISKNAATGVKTKEGNEYNAGHIIVCAGNLSPILVPALQPYIKITGHPVFHINPTQAELFSAEKFPVIAADISNTGWYGFPIHPKANVVKIANHGKGIELKNPLNDERVVYDEDIAGLRNFLSESIPSLANDKIVYTRRCCYTDTLDGHFWIDNHPEIKNLTIGTGGSGHAFKMGPVIGDMIAKVAEGKNHKWSARYRWRDLKLFTKNMEEARFTKNESS